MKYSKLSLALLLLFATTAATGQSGPNGTPYAERDQGKALIQHLSEQEGLDASWVRAVLNDAEYQPKIIAAMQRPAEKVLPWYKYRQIFLKQDRIDGGVAFIQKHADLFAQVEQEYGVPPAIIAAIVGVETRFGGFLGRDRVLDALVTLGFDYPPRADFFYSELGHFLKLCKSEGLDARSVVGSYAGAMGMPQFIASSYAAYAVDFNNNGKRDLWNEPSDIIGSVANYFAEHGWKPGQAIAAAAVPGSSAGADIERSKRETRYEYAELAQAGVALNPAPADATPVGLLELDYADGSRFWVGYHNFFVITSYNHSPLYAMAVYQLSQEIQKGLVAAQTQAQVRLND